MQLVEKKDIRTVFRHNLIRVDGDQRLATFKSLADDSQVEVSVSFTLCKNRSFSLIILISLIFYMLRLLNQHQKS